MSDEPKVDIPCKLCKKFQKCLKEIHELKVKQYGKDHIIDNEDYEEYHYFHTDLISKLTTDCEIMKDYFPFDIVSRDGLMVRPEFNYSKHGKMLSEMIMDEDEWYSRNLVLYWFFLSEVWK